MCETWLQAYIFLAFRLHRIVEMTYESLFVEDYWGLNIPGYIYRELSYSTLRLE